MLRGDVEPGDGVHQHREEGHADDDRRLALPVEAEPHHEDRRDADDRQRRDEVADRQQPALEEGRAVDEDGDDEARAAAEHVAGQHRLEEGLLEIGPERRDRGREPRPDLRRRRQQHLRHVGAARDHLPDRAAGRARRPPGSATPTALPGTSRRRIASDSRSTKSQAKAQAATSAEPEERRLDRRRPAAPGSAPRRRARRCAPSTQSDTGTAKRSSVSAPTAAKTTKQRSARRHRAAPGPAQRAPRRRPRPARIACSRLMRRAPIARLTSRSATPDRDHQHRREPRGEEQRRPDLHGLPVVGAGEQPHAEPAARVVAELAHHRADQRDGDAHLHRGEEERHRRRPAQLGRTPARRSHCRCASGRAGSAPASAAPSPCRRRPGRS